MFQLARVALAADDVELAAKCLGEALKCDPTNTDYQRIYTEVATRQAAHRAAEQAMKGDDKMKANMACQHVALGEAALARGDADLAHHNFQMAMKMAEVSNAALDGMSQDRAEAVEHDEEEEEKVRRATRRDQAQRYFQQGELARQNEEWDEALKCYEAAAELDSSWPKYRTAADGARFEVKKRKPLVLEGPDPLTRRDIWKIRAGLSLALLLVAAGYTAPKVMPKEQSSLAATFVEWGPFQRLERSQGVRWSGTLEEGFAALSPAERVARCTGIADALPGPGVLLLASSDGHAVLCPTSLEVLGEDVDPATEGELLAEPVPDAD